MENKELTEHHRPFCEWISAHYPKLVFMSNRPEAHGKTHIRVLELKLSSSDAIADFMLVKTTPLFAGLFIEMKQSRHKVLTLRDRRIRMGDKHVAAQHAFLTKANNDGYLATFSGSMGESKMIMKAYLANDIEFLKQNLAVYSLSNKKLKDYDNCEWNPEKNETADADDPFHGYATNSVGTKDNIHLCEKRSKLKRFSRMKKIKL